jgi:hypothetical protein
LVHSDAKSQTLFQNKNLLVQNLSTLSGRLMKCLQNETSRISQQNLRFSTITYGMKILTIREIVWMYELQIKNQSVLTHYDTTLSGICCCCCYKKGTFYNLQIYVDVWTLFSTLNTQQTYKSFSQKRQNGYLSNLSRSFKLESFGSIPLWIDKILCIGIMTV